MMIELLKLIFLLCLLQVECGKHVHGDVVSKKRHETDGRSPMMTSTTDPNRVDDDQQLPQQERITRVDRLSSIGDRRVRYQARNDVASSLKDEELTRSSLSMSSAQSSFIRYIMKQEGDDPSKTNRKISERGLGTADTTDDDKLYVYYSENTDNDDVFGDHYINNQLCYSPSESYASYNYSCVADTNILPPSCLADPSDFVYDSSGQLSSMQTFYKCLANVYDAAKPATMYNGSYHGCLNIYTIMTLLNLVKINEIDGSATLQITMEFGWKDRRYDMPVFWDKTYFGYSGLDLTHPLLHNDSVTLWTPEIVFPDAAELEIQSQSLTLFEYNYFWWTVTYRLTLAQPQFDFKDYPNDEQDLIVRFSIPSYDMEEIQLRPVGVGCSALEDGSCAFSHNPIWNWDEDKKYCTTYVDEFKPAFSLWPSYAYYKISLQRQGSGVVIRLILPLTMLLLLSALTFWLSYENRVDTTITLLLSVSALYIVILGNIPMVGYLTNVDTFVCWMFLSLVLVCTTHQVYATLHEKADRWPLRIVYLRVIEMAGRTCLIPTILLYFLTTIMIQFTTERQTNGLVGIISTIAVIIFVRELYAVHIAFQDACDKLVEKINVPTLEVNQVSPIEAIVLNWLLFGHLSLSKHYIAAELKKNGHICYRNEGKLHLRHLIRDEVVSNIDSVIDNSLDVEFVETPVSTTVGVEDPRCEGKGSEDAPDLQDIYSVHSFENVPQAVLRKRSLGSNRSNSEQGLQQDEKPLVITEHFNSVNNASITIDGAVDSHAIEE